MTMHDSTTCAPAPSGGAGAGPFAKPYPPRSRTGRIPAWLTLLSLTLLAPTIQGTPPFDSDPSCRAPNLLLEVERSRAESRQRRPATTIGLADAPLQPSLTAAWHRPSSRPLLRVRGKAGSHYRLLTAASLEGPWVPVRGFMMDEPEAQWIDTATDAAAARFYRVDVPTALQVEPLASNFRLLDLTGKSHELYDNAHRQGIAMIAAGDRLENLAELLPELSALHATRSSHGTEVWVVLSDATTPRDQLRDAARKLAFDMPVLLDRDLLAGSILGVAHTTEAVLVRAPDFVAVYRGAIRDGERFYLREAIQALRAGRGPEVWQAGLRAPSLPSLDGAKLSYSREIAPFLRTYCVRCHRPNSGAPFAFSSSSEVLSRASAIRHQVLSGNMPPWHADPEHGQFTNSLALPSEVKRKLVAWLDAGAPLDAADPLRELPPNPPAHGLSLELGAPDAIVTLSVQSVRATGAEPYRTFPVPAPNTSNVWLRAASLVPSNPAVVHHYTVYQPLHRDQVGEINLGFTFYVPGRAAQAYPDGTGMYLPALSTLLFELHYTPNGTTATDQPTLNLWFHQKPPARRLITFTVANSRFEIPPGEPEHLVSARQTFDREVMLHSLACHMHFRGRSMIIDMIEPEGLRETLLSVPRYDFFWQTRYQLATPKTLPAGTTVEVRGTFDNSVQNLANPDPAATVRWGQQSWEEMFMAVLEIAE